MLAAHGDGKRLGEAERELPGKVEVEDRLPITETSGVEVALALRSERRVQSVVDLIVEAVVADAGREVRGVRLSGRA